MSSSAPRQAAVKPAIGTNGNSGANADVDIIPKRRERSQIVRVTTFVLAVFIFLWSMIAPIRILFLQVDYSMQVGSITAQWVDRDDILSASGLYQPAEDLPSTIASSAQLQTLSNCSNVIKSFQIIPQRTVANDTATGVPTMTTTYKFLAMDSPCKGLSVPIGGYLWDQIPSDPNELEVNVDSTGGRLCESIAICVDEAIKLDYMWQVLLADIKNAGGIRKDGKFTPVSINANFRRLTMSNERELELYSASKYRMKRRDYLQKLGGFRTTSTFYSTAKAQYRLGGAWVPDVNGSFRAPYPEETKEDLLTLSKFRILRNASDTSGRGRYYREDHTISYMESMVAHLLPLDIISYRNAFSNYILVTFILPDENNCGVGGMTLPTPAKPSEPCIHNTMAEVMADAIADGLDVIGCDPSLLNRADLIQIARDFAKNMDISVLEPVFKALLTCPAVYDSVSADLVNIKTLSWYLSKAGPFMASTVSSLRMGNLYDGELSLTLQGKTGAYITLGDSSATLWTISVEAFVNQQQWCTRSGLFEPITKRGTPQFPNFAFPWLLTQTTNASINNPIFTFRECLASRYFMMPYMQVWATMPYGGALTYLPVPPPPGFTRAEAGELVEDSVIVEMAQLYRRVPAPNGGDRLDLLTALNDVVNTRVLSDTITVATFPYVSPYLTQYNMTRVNHALQSMLSRPVARTSTLIHYCGMAGGCSQVGGRAAPDNNTMPYIDGYEMGMQKMLVDRFFYKQQRGRKVSDSATSDLVDYVRVPEPLCTGFELVLIDSSTQRNGYLTAGIGARPCNAPREITTRRGLNGLGTGSDTFSLFNLNNNDLGMYKTVPAALEWVLTIPDKSIVNLTMLGFNTTALGSQKWAISLVSAYALYSKDLYYELAQQPTGTLAGAGPTIPTKLSSLDYGIRGSVKSSFGRLNSLSSFAAMISVLIQVVDVYSTLQILSIATLIARILRNASARETGTKGKYKLPEFSVIDNVPVFLNLPLQYVVSKGVGHLFLSNLSSMMAVANLIRPIVKMTTTGTRTNLFLVSDISSFWRTFTMSLIMSAGQIISTVWMACIDIETTSREQITLWLQIAIDFVFLILAGVGIAVNLQGGIFENYIDNATMIAIFIVAALYILHRRPPRQGFIKAPVANGVARIIGDSTPFRWQVYLQASMRLPLSKIGDGKEADRLYVKASLAGATSHGPTADKDAKSIWALRWDEAAVLLAIAEYRGSSLGSKYVIIQRSRVEVVHRDVWTTHRAMSEASEVYIVGTLNILIEAPKVNAGQKSLSARVLKAVGGSKPSLIAPAVPIATLVTKVDQVLEDVEDIDNSRGEHSITSNPGSAAHDPSGVMSKSVPDYASAFSRNNAPGSPSGTGAMSELDQLLLDGGYYL